MFCLYIVALDLLARIAVELSKKRATATLEPMGACQHHCVVLFALGVYTITLIIFVGLRRTDNDTKHYLVQAVMGIC
jgi:hypothetical protein